LVEKCLKNNIIKMILTTFILISYCFHLHAFVNTNNQIAKRSFSSAVQKFQHQIITIKSTAESTDSSSDVKKVRRIRYSGSYPKAFKERYKEIRGDADTISKVMSKGSTPAGTHVPIMLKEVLEHLGLNQDKKVKELKTCFSVDCTLGFGGHTTEIIKKLIPFRKWKHIGIDQDVIEIAKTKERVIKALSVENANTNENENINENENEIINENVNEKSMNSNPDFLRSRISFCHQNFGDLEELGNAQGFLGRVDILLADLGYSSMQIDDPLRGFTYKAEGPLDMRMDLSKNETALGFLERISRDELITILQENSDEVMAVQIATCLKMTPIPGTTTELSERIRKTMKDHATKEGEEKPTKEALDSTVARTMQAIRIEVNGEFLVLDKLLESLPVVLNEGGRVVFLTFHSGEDRRVKKALKAGFKNGIYSEWSRDVVRADYEERRSNPRSKCAKLRWAIRSDT